MVREVLGRMKTGIKAATGMRYDAFDRLRLDHMKAETLLIELRLSRSSEHRRALFREVRPLLELHMKIEEELLYPACARIPELERVIDHAHADHQLVKAALMDLAVIDPGTVRYTELLTTLIQKIELHVMKEENVVFTAAGKRMRGEELEALDERMLEMRRTRARVTSRAA